jgi:RND family efflux transporter MFP subunit
VIIWLWLLACEPDVEEARAEGTHVVALRTAPVEAATWRAEVEITGTLEPIASVQLGFDVPGRVESLRVSRGGFLRKGDALATLDSRMAEAQLAQAEAGVTAARAQADAAEASWQRIGKLGDAVSPQQRSDAEAGVAGARAQLEQASAALRLAKTNLAWHTLRSPIDGIVTMGPDNAGILVGAGSPLFVVEDLSALRLKGAAGEEHATWLRDGLVARVFPGTPGATTAIPAVVERVVPSLDPATRRLPIEVRIDSPPPELRAHGFARAVIATEVDQEAWSVPRGAVVARPDFAVLVVSTPDAPPRKVPVEVLGEETDRSIVRGALQAGDTVVVDPPHGYGS